MKPVPNTFAVVVLVPAMVDIAATNPVIDAVTLLVLIQEAEI